MSTDKDLHCCMCEAVDRHGNIVEQVLHSTVYVCVQCGHTACMDEQRQGMESRHYVPECGMCYPCHAEEHGLNPFMHADNA